MPLRFVLYFLLLALAVLFEPAWTSDFRTGLLMLAIGAILLASWLGVVGRRIDRPVTAAASGIVGMLGASAGLAFCVLTLYRPGQWDVLLQSRTVPEALWNAVPLIDHVWFALAALILVCAIVVAVYRNAFAPTKER